MSDEGLNQPDGPTNTSGKKRTDLVIKIFGTIAWIGAYVTFIIGMYPIAKPEQSTTLLPPVDLSAIGLPFLGVLWILKRMWLP